MKLLTFLATENAIQKVLEPTKKKELNKKKVRAVRVYNRLYRDFLYFSKFMKFLMVLFFFNPKMVAARRR